MFVIGYDEQVEMISCGNTIIGRLDKELEPVFSLRLLRLCEKFIS